jgi:hypothetical protein
LHQAHARFTRYDLVLRFNAGGYCKVRADCRNHRNRATVLVRLFLIQFLRR